MAKVIVVNVPGPQGPKGDQGEPGSSGSGSINTSSLVTTASFNQFTSSYNTGSFSGSFIGTASWAIYALTTSLTPNAIVTASSTPEAYTIRLTKGDGTFFDVALTQPAPSPPPIIDTGSFFTNATLNSDRLIFTIGDRSTIALSLTSSYVLVSQTSSFVQNSQTSSFVLNNQTGSFVANSQTGSFVQTSSFNNFTQSYYTDSASFDSRINNFNIDISSLVTTSSFNNFTQSIQSEVNSLTNATSSYVLNNQTSSFVNNNQTSSFVQNSQTGSFITNDQTSSMLEPYVLISVTSSMLESYVLIAATSSMLEPYLLSFQTSSFIINSQTGSFITNNQTGSFVQNSQTSSFVLNSQTSSFVQNSQTSSMTVLSSSYALTASYALNGGSGGTVDTSSLVTTASFNQFTSSYNTGSFSGSFIGTASWATNSITSSYALFNPYIVTIGSRIITDNTYIIEGSKGYKHIGYNANIIKTRTIANTNGNIDVNIKRNGITLGTISLINQSSSLDTTLTGWTTQLNTDDLLEFYVSQSSTYITDLTIFIDIQARQ